MPPDERRSSRRWRRCPLRGAIALAGSIHPLSHAAQGWWACPDTQLRPRTPTHRSTSEMDILAGVAVFFLPADKQVPLALAGAALRALGGLRQRRRRAAAARGGRRSGGGAPPPTAAQAEALIAWRQLTCTLTDQKTGATRYLLRDVAGTATPGRLLGAREERWWAGRAGECLCSHRTDACTGLPRLPHTHSRAAAIMGPSGGGKTTLLSALAGQMAATNGMRLTGSVTANGVPAATAGVRSAFVQQDDIFFAQLTVRETLMMAAELRLPREVGAGEREALVEGVIRRLGLAKAADTPVGDAKTRGLSGGEHGRTERWRCGALGRRLCACFLACLRRRGTPRHPHAAQARRSGSRLRWSFCRVRC